MSSVDLNLLLVLDTLLEERSATRAARRLHVTQSAVSNSLAKLRRILDDPLVVRSQGRLVPTPRAVALGPALRASIEGLRAVVEGGQFEPRTTTRRFTLACTDVVTKAIGPSLVAILAERAPESTLRIVTVEHQIQRDGLATGDVDAMLGIPPTTPRGCSTEVAYTDEMVVIARRGHPRMRGRLTLKKYVELPHIEVALFGEPEPRVDEALAKVGARRRIVTSVPEFASIPLLVAHGDAIATTSRRLAEVFLPRLPIEMHRAPIPFAPLEVKLIWHARTDADEGARFFRDVVRRAIAGSRTRLRRPRSHVRRSPSIGT